MLANMNLVGVKTVFQACLSGLSIVVIGAAAVAQEDSAGKSPIEVKIHDEKPVTIEAMGGLDPQQHIKLNWQGNMFINTQVNNMNLHLGPLQTMFHFDGQVMFPGNPPGRFVSQNQQLPVGKNKKARTGFSS